MMRMADMSARILLYNDYLQAKKIRYLEFTWCIDYNRCDKCSDNCSLRCDSIFDLINYILCPKL
jgi:hypothetical protein